MIRSPSLESDTATPTIEVVVRLDYLQRGGGLLTRGQKKKKDSGKPEKSERVDLRLLGYLPFTRHAVFEKSARKKKRAHENEEQPVRKERQAVSSKEGHMRGRTESLGKKLYGGAKVGEGIKGMWGDQAKKTFDPKKEKDTYSEGLQP